MFFKIHKTYRDVVAVCDSELVGKKFESSDGKFQLDVKENFFRGEEVSEKELIFLMKKFSLEDAIFNIVGEKSVQAGLKAGIIFEEGVKEIGGIKFALILA